MIIIKDKKIVKLADAKLNGSENVITKITHKTYSIDATADSIVDPPYTETYGNCYKENRNENRRDNKKLMLYD